MFKKKYIFETHRTRLSRYIKNSGFFLMLLSIVYSMACVVLILFAGSENRRAKEAFYKRTPDLLVVFTGQTGRIPYAVKLAKTYKYTPLFITGVNAKNSINSLLSKLSLDPSFDPNKLNIDYLARNTVENALSTRRFLQNNKNIKTVLIISHDYHIMRIKLLMESLKSRTGGHHFYYTDVNTPYSEWRNIKILFKEVFKLIRTYGFLILWTPEITEQNLAL